MQSTRAIWRPSEMRASLCAGRLSWGMAPAVASSHGAQQSHAPCHRRQSQRTCTSSSWTAPQKGQVEAVRNPCPCTRTAVHHAPNNSPRSSEASFSVKATRSAARDMPPHPHRLPTPPEGERLASLKLARRMVLECIPHSVLDGPHRLRHHVQGLRLPRHVPAPLTVPGVPAQRVQHRAECRAHGAIHQ